MGESSTTMVTPIYGWGWIVGGESRHEPPRPFMMTLDQSEPKVWTGIVTDTGHEFQGRRVTLSQRHVEWDGYVNIAIEAFAPTERPSTGFGTVSGGPPYSA